MRIQKILNNNVVFALDDNKNEVVLMGKGIGFRQMRGMTVNKNKIEKVFKMQTASERNKIAELLTQISAENFKLADEIIQLAQRELDKEIQENIYITLTDHVVFAMERVSKGISFTNQLLWEIKNFYPEEYKIGKKALDIIKDRTGIVMPDDEAGFIALHIANAHMDEDIPLVETTTQIIKNALHIVELSNNIELDEESLDYGRFVIHLKFCINRAFSGKMLNENDENFINLIKMQYSEAHRTASRIAQYINNEYGIQLTEDELLYLTIHIKRIIDSAKKSY